MSRYEGLYTFDVDNHMYIPVGQVDDDYFDVREEEPKQPLIKDEKIRKAVRAWAEVHDVLEVGTYRIGGYSGGIYMQIHDKKDGRCRISVLVPAGTETEGTYTIAELCGEEEE